MQIELGLTPENKSSDNVKRIEALNDKIMTRSRYVPGDDIVMESASLCQNITVG